MRLRSLWLPSDDEWKEQLNLIGADACTWDRLSMKSRVLAFSIDSIPSNAANILKQCMLSGGADAIVSRGTVACSSPETGVLLTGTPKQLLRAAESLHGQPFGLTALAEVIRRAVLLPPAPPTTILTGAGTLDSAGGPIVMGILNLTPDSFSDGGRYADVPSAVSRAMEMTREGASIVDIGAESTRPVSDPVPPKVQLARIMPVLHGLREADLPAVISVDTSSAEVARAVLDTGAGMINDVTALSDPDMTEVLAGAGVPVVLMHMRGTPRNMQDAPVYVDVLEEVYSFLESRIESAEAGGISRKRIIVDPGIGFGKRLQDNLRLIGRLREFSWLGCRVLLGHSRKSFLGAITGIHDAALRDEASHVISAVTYGSADILRVHDVRGTVQALSIAGELARC